MDGLQLILPIASILMVKRATFNPLFAAAGCLNSGMTCSHNVDQILLSVCILA